ncbi:MAG: hypothetical protein FIA97_11245 [Methylococcaceae bacterium]|nr:hypothetical protein [Methylococcaceae bacterium]
MLKWLSRLLRRSSVEPGRNNLKSLEDAGPDRITDPDRIAALLDDLCRHHLLLSVMVPGSNYPFVSSLLRIEEGALIFDELNPAIGQPLVAEQGRFRVEAVLRGIGISFTVTEFATDTSAGPVTYRATPPTEIIHLQRRRSHRIPMSPSQHVGFHGDQFVEDLKVNGTVANLSREGLAVLAKLSAPLHAHEELINCAITLPQGETVRFNLAVCFVETLPWAKHSVIGGRFSSISPQDQRHLEDFLLDLERQMLRDGR